MDEKPLTKIGWAVIILSVSILIGSLIMHEIYSRQVISIQSEIIGLQEDIITEQDKIINSQRLVILNQTQLIVKLQQGESHKQCIEGTCNYTKNRTEIVNTYLSYYNSTFSSNFTDFDDEFQITYTAINGN